ncbi:UNKNOWN [Stylonychia lemnae]|uniref:Uncharacterized protein n=1 Tax=Stylonychia lemnae TaxID=5949 RepID=A0A078AX82_STYLE|nr:UNKNOWN [Stylonychia lemnae]|eukprot:CDW87065.1 UNKNOWN [Stylonychia lemnae]
MKKSQSVNQSFNRKKSTKTVRDYDFDPVGELRYEFNNEKQIEYLNKSSYAEQFFRKMLKTLDKDHEKFKKSLETGDGSKQLIESKYSKNYSDLFYPYKVFSKDELKLEHGDGGSTKRRSKDRYAGNNFLHVNQTQSKVDSGISTIEQIDKIKKKKDYEQQIIKEYRHSKTQRHSRRQSVNLLPPINVQIVNDEKLNNDRFNHEGEDINQIGRKVSKDFNRVQYDNLDTLEKMRQTIVQRVKNKNMEYQQDETNGKANECLQSIRKYDQSMQNLNHELGRRLSKQEIILSKIKSQASSFQNQISKQQTGKNLSMAKSSLFDNKAMQENSTLNEDNSQIDKKSIIKQIKSYRDMQNELKNINEISANQSSNLNKSLDKKWQFSQTQPQFNFKRISNQLQKNNELKENLNHIIKQLNKKQDNIVISQLNKSPYQKQYTKGLLNQKLQADQKQQQIEKEIKLFSKQNRLEDTVNQIIKSQSKISRKNGGSGFLEIQSARVQFRDDNLVTMLEYSRDSFCTDESISDSGKKQKSPKKEVQIREEKDPNFQREAKKRASIRMLNFSEKILMMIQQKSLQIQAEQEASQRESKLDRIDSQFEKETRRSILRQKYTQQQRDSLLFDENNEAIKKQKNKIQQSISDLNHEKKLEDQRIQNEYIINHISETLKRLENQKLEQIRLNHTLSVTGLKNMKKYEYAFNNSSRKATETLANEFLETIKLNQKNKTSEVASADNLFKLTKDFMKDRAEPRSKTYIGDKNKKNLNANLSLDFPSQDNSYNSQIIAETSWLMNLLSLLPKTQQTKHLMRSIRNLQSK